MRVDRHYDPIDELEKNILKELEGITKQLGGTMCQKTKCTSEGRQSKLIEIEYSVETKK